MIPVLVKTWDFSTFMENAYLTVTKEDFSLMSLRTFLLFADVLKENTGNGIILTILLLVLVTLEEIPQILLIQLAMATIVLLTNAV